MKALLDTHVFLWWIAGDDRIPAKAREFIANEKSVLYVSAASIWEMAIKIQIGKLSLPEPIPLFLESQLRSNDFSHLPISLAHAISLHDLPLLHRDPFDRMLVSQARFEQIALISGDEKIWKYDVETIW